MSSDSKGKPVLLWVGGFFVTVFLVYFLFANTIIKAILESKLGESYGAEVNIDEFDHSLFPTTVTLKGIALTNPTKPAYNQVFVGEANADVALAPLLKDEVIVNNLNLLEVQFDTQRAAPGEVYRVPERSLSFDEMKETLEAKVSRPLQLIPWSAKNKISLSGYEKALGEFLNNSKDLDLADVAYSLNTTRENFNHRSFIVAGTTAEASESLNSEKPKTKSSVLKVTPNEIGFLFPGQGSQFLQMGKILYDNEQVYKEAIDKCSKLLVEHLKFAPLWQLLI